MRYLLSVLLIAMAVSHADAASRKEQEKQMINKLDVYLSQVKPFELNSLQDSKSNDKLEVYLVKKPKGK